MLSKSQLQFIKSLHQKKFRKEHGLFIVEGIKSITEFLHSDYIIHSVFCTSKVEPKIGNFLKKIKLSIISDKDLTAITTLKTPQGILALVKIPDDKRVDKQELRNSFTLVLDNIQDPGNLGTIIRTADWFGINKIICSEDTVEAFNPKVVQATMGSLARTSIVYTDLQRFFQDNTIPIFVALLNGNSIYETNFGDEGLIVLGNEGNGVSKNLLSPSMVSVTIPRFGNAESLNVAVSAAIFCSEIRKKR
jgi:RNA methyltransferase, TrmH family